MKVDHKTEEKQQLFYALVLLALAIANTNKDLKQRDKDVLCKILITEMERSYPQSNYSDIIYHGLKKERRDFNTTYNWAIHSMRLLSQSFSADMKLHFVDVIRKVVDSFPPPEYDKHEIVDQFKFDLASF